MTVITNAELVLKDSKGNVGTVRSVTDNDIVKIRNAITDIGKLVDPVSHLPIKATATTVGVVQLADDEAIAAGTTGRVVDAKQLQDAILGVTPANCVTNVAAGSTANKIKVTKDDYTTTITIDNVEHSSFADQATHAVNADEATHATQADTAASANSVAWDNVSGKPSSYTPSSHTHDDRYYTESEINTKLTDYLPIAGGNVTGNLTVQNKNVVRSVNGVNADAQGNIDLIPCGSYIQHAGASAPSGFLVCNGGAISRTTYAKLFSVIGTKYGAGDGSTTFNLPNLIGRFLEGGSASGTVYEAGLPNIIGTFDTRITNYKINPPLGALAFSERTHENTRNFASNAYDTSADIYALRFIASSSNSIYGNSSTVQPKAITCLICIKY